MIKSKKQNIDIPRENYIKLSILVGITLIISIIIFLISKYNYLNRNKVPVIRDTLKEILVKDSDYFGNIDEMFKENERVLLYFGVSDDSNCRILEESMKEYLKNNNLLDTVYINISNVNTDKFFELFNNNYSFNDLKVSNYPAFVVVEEGHISSLVERSDNDLLVSDIDRMLLEREIIR